MWIDGGRGSKGQTEGGMDRLMGNGGTEEELLKRTNKRTQLLYFTMEIQELHMTFLRHSYTNK